VIATNHSDYTGVLRRIPADALVADPWDVTGARQVFAVAREVDTARPAVAERTAPPAH
jgi:hypothetical protein